MKTISNSLSVVMLALIGTGCAVEPEASVRTDYEDVYALSRATATGISTELRAIDDDALVASMEVDSGSGRWRDRDGVDRWLTVAGDSADAQSLLDRVDPARTEVDAIPTDPTEANELVHSLDAATKDVPYYVAFGPGCDFYVWGDMQCEICSDWQFRCYTCTWETEGNLHWYGQCNAWYEW